MLRAEIEVDSLNVVMDISEICNEHSHTDPQWSKCEDSVDRQKSDFLCVCVCLNSYSLTLLSLALTHTWLYSLLKE